MKLLDAARRLTRRRGGRPADAWLASVFAASALIMFTLGLVNREANDDHLEVALRLINGHPTEIEDCWECYHPRLYHGSWALAIRLLGLRTRAGMTLAGQMLSVAAAILTLAVVRA